MLRPRKNKGLIYRHTVSESETPITGVQVSCFPEAFLTQANLLVMACPVFYFVFLLRFPLGA